ncbi:zf-CCHC domain-containing protein/UBN2 domain-containing protein [Senna tora]|uniref:Zf-CCHC domain-containing protein/UBN2 domain-containing protein n=1 Tax=Senna tora TaxID=362788 RepID=A0A834XEJ8_9FABA|nr:zf-CCHC domain-containing protein/UBN2 domain-containing protein [Senna tora]
MAYESTFLKDDQQELKKEDSVALKTGTTHEEDKSSTDPDEDKDMALITRKLYNFYKKKYKNNQWKKEGNSSKVTCYECNKPGHIKAECPQLKGGFPAKETANLCLMAKESEDEHQLSIEAFGAIKLEKEALEEKIKLMEEEFAMSALITENRKLKATIDKLNYDLEQFCQRRRKLNLILGSQRSPNDKTGLGFTGESSEQKGK